MKFRYKSVELFGFAMCLLLPMAGWYGFQGYDMLQLTRENLSSGYWHTLWTGHLLHFTFDHFLWDAVMFAVFTVLLWREERWGLWLWIAIAAPLISIFVFFWEPQIAEYRGLSALDTVLYTRFCLGLGERLKGWERYVYSCVPIAVLLAKIIFEASSGQTLFVSDLGPGVVPLASAHSAGLAAGFAWYGARIVTRRLSPKFVSEGLH